MMACGAVGLRFAFACDHPFTTPGSLGGLHEQLRDNCQDRYAYVPLQNAAGSTCAWRALVNKIR
jgi:hypothetical protein